MEACYRRALKAARERGAQGCDLRAVASLANLLHAHGRLKEARVELESVLPRLPGLSEGRDFGEALQQLQSLPA